MNGNGTEITLLTYTELLKSLENGSSNHLLLGNGFNNSLGIKTNYSEIFCQMKKIYSGYQSVENYLKAENFDIEKLIGYLKNQTDTDEKNFLPSYIERKVKLDFMHAANEIVQESIKHVYQDNNKGIYLLLKNFTNYFTLNYDPFLYLLLMKFKKNEGEDALAIQNNSFFLKKDLNNTQNNIYRYIKDARESGELQIIIKKSDLQVDLKTMKKGHFQVIIEKCNEIENKGWKIKDIKKVCDQMWKEENNRPELNVNDGFQGELFKNNEQQNLYFLHGAFQIIKRKKDIQKITAKQNVSFVRKLEEMIYDENTNIVCVLRSQSEDKKTQIEENKYLKKCFYDLSKIDGSLVILGSSLAENDKHIFEQINVSFIKDIYISSREESKKDDYKKASELFREKKVYLFDYTSISYKEVI